MDIEIDLGKMEQALKGYHPTFTPMKYLCLCICFLCNMYLY